MNFAEWLVRSACRTPNAPALLRGERIVANYAEFARSAASLGASFAARGIAPGDRVAIFMGNRTEYLEVLYGAWFAGAAVVPINAKLHAKEAAWIVADSGARVVVTDERGTGLVDAFGTTPPQVIRVDAPGFAELRETVPLAEPVEMEPDDLAWLFYTSGTTGRPKGVQITTQMLIAMALTYFVEVEAVEAGNATLYAAPMSHGAGIYNFMFVMRGARHVVPESGGFDAAEILDLAPRIGNVSMFAAPTMVRRLVDAGKQTGRTGEGIRTIVYAGGPMYLADIIEAVDVMGPRFVQIYGQGECPMAITALSRADIADRSHPRWRERLASVGVAQSDLRVRIVDADGHEVPRGETGEIVVKGLPVMPGYWRNQEATQKTIRDGWLWTGDMGQMDAEGYVTLQDRSKDMIISGGSNIYPREVEEVLLAHPDVREVAVVGRPDPEWGEIVVAFVAPVEGAEVDPAALDALCLDQIARYKRPKEYVTMPDLPKSNYGKILKTELRKRLEDRGPKNGKS